MGTRFDIRACRAPSLRDFWRASAIAVAVLLSPIAFADDSAALEAQAVEMERLSDGDATAAEATVAGQFEALAGSAENAARLVYALRNGYEAVLTEGEQPDSPVARIYPVTGRLGLGNVFISLALAQEALAGLGIEQATAAEIDAVLNGGEVVVDGRAVRLRGVLAQRVDGVGWGRIAASMGVRLGPVLASIRAANGALPRGGAQLARGNAIGGRAAHWSEKAERGERPTRPDRPERPDRPQRPDRPDRPDRPVQAK